jgi:hypothetical protein
LLEVCDGQTSFLPEKLDDSWLFELAYLTLNDVLKGFHKGKLDGEGDKERDRSYD